MQVGIVTLFPEMFQALTEYGVSGRAVRAGLVSMAYWNPRDFTADRHRTVDDRPYGGGPGMLMKTEPLKAAVEAAGNALTDSGGEQPRVVYMSPQGRRLRQQDVDRLAKAPRLILLCGRYEGIDERIVETLVDEELSIGDYVISGGELAAMVLIDAMIRRQPGALGHESSAAEDSFADGLLDCPHYTRPEVVDGLGVPDVLLSGDHAAIARWREKQSLGMTWLKRRDLLEDKELSDSQRRLLEEYIRERRDKGASG